MADDKPIPPKPPVITDLVPDPDNVNRGTERGSGLLEKTLHELGFGRPILIDKNRKVIAGNQVLDAAINAGIIRLRVIRTKGNEVIAHMREDIDLDTKAGRELALADNFIGRASFDPDVQTVVRQAKDYDIDLEAVGISAAELKEMIGKAVDADEAAAEPSMGPESKQHRVVIFCPDAETQRAAFEKLQPEYDRPHEGYRVTLERKKPRK